MHRRTARDPLVIWRDVMTVKQEIVAKEDEEGPIDHREGDCDGTSESIRNRLDMDLEDTSAGEWADQRRVDIRALLEEMRCCRPVRSGRAHPVRACSVRG